MTSNDSVVRCGKTWKQFASFEFLWQASNASSTSENTPLDSTAETTPKPSRALKLEDYDESTFQPDVKGNRVRRETENTSTAGDDADDAEESTTSESSTVPMLLQESDSSDNNFVTLSPPSIDSSTQQNFYYIPSYDHYPYPPSSVPSAQHVSIAHPPNHKPYLPPVKNYYDFYPSQPDYSYNPLCINSIPHKFSPISHDAASYYRKWKWGGTFCKQFSNCIINCWRAEHLCG